MATDLFYDNVGYVSIRSIIDVDAGTIVIDALHDGEITGFCFSGGKDYRSEKFISKRDIESLTDSNNHYINRTIEELVSHLITKNRFVLGKDLKNKYGVEPRAYKPKNQVNKVENSYYSPYAFLSSLEFSGMVIPPSRIKELIKFLAREGISPQEVDGLGIVYTTEQASKIFELCKRRVNESLSEIR